jgi:hypothetical protein
MPRTRPNPLSVVALCLCGLGTPSTTLAFDPFWGYHGWEIGVGTVPANGGIIGGNLSYSIWRFEVGLGLGYLGFAAWGRFNITVIDDKLIPWIRGGFSPDPYAAFFNVWTSGEFAEGGVSYCSSLNPSFACLEAGFGGGRGYFSTPFLLADSPHADARADLPLWR